MVVDTRGLGPVSRSILTDVFDVPALRELLGDLRARRVRVVPVSGRSPMLLRAVVRTALMLLVLPAVVWNRDTQPLHDVVAGTAVVTL